MLPQPAFFEQHQIRRVYDEPTETWWFSVVDIVQALTQQPDDLTARKYWSKLKERLAKEGSEVVTNCHQLKMVAVDGKQRLTDAATAGTLLRLVQSVPSPKAEPIKLWLAKVGHERMQELANPELALDRARDLWKSHGRSEKWIQQRMSGQETRNKLTDYWSDHDIKEGQEFAILTNLIHQEWTGLSVKGHKELKGLNTQNLRDHMTEAELIFTALAELTTRQVAEGMNATGMPCITRSAWRSICQAQVVSPFFSLGQAVHAGKPWEAQLTNRTLFHAQHRERSSTRPFITSARQSTWSGTPSCSVS